MFLNPNITIFDSDSRFFSSKITILDRRIPIFYRNILRSMGNFASPGVFFFPVIAPKGHQKGHCRGRCGERRCSDGDLGNGIVMGYFAVCIYICDICMCIYSSTKI